MIIKKKTGNIKVKDLNFKNPYTWPSYQTTGDNSFILALISGVRNAGKSTLALNIIETEKKHLLEGSSKVYFISPTRDAKVDYFIEKYPDNFEYVDELNMKNMEQVLKDMSGRVEEWKDKFDAYKLLDKYLRKPKSLTMEEMSILEEMDFFEHDDELKDFDGTHPPLNSLIIDDSVGNEMICEARSKQGKWFQKFVLRHRHFPYHCNIFILSQHIKSICKYFRTNCNWVCLFPFRDHNVLKSVFDEYSVLFNNDIANFLKIMDDIRKRDDHSFLSIYYDKIQYVKVGFNELLEFTNGKENDKPEK